MIVIDTSVVNKLFLTNEVGHKEARIILERHLRKIEPILIPDLLFYEASNTFATKTSVSLSKILKYFLNDLYSFNFETFYSNREYIKAVVKFARKYKVSVYDAAYAVLAKMKKCDLVTADEKFVSKVNLFYIKALEDLTKGN